MTMIVLDPIAERSIIDQRRRLGLDHHDEVWDGVYVVSPLPNDEHQDVVGGLTTCLTIAIQYPGLGKVRPGVNVSDRVENWEHNYRGPDVVVFTTDTLAQCHGAFWHGGPDFAVEVVSQYDRSREKFDFYAEVHTRELLIVDRYPWALELYRLNEAGAYDLVGRLTLDDPQILASQVLPLSFQLQPGDERPNIVIRHTDGGQTWSA